MNASGLLNTCKFNVTVHLLIVSIKDIISTIIEGSNKTSEVEDTI